MQVQIFPTRATGISIAKPINATVVKVNKKSIRILREHASKEEAFHLLKVTKAGRKVYSNGPNERIVL